MIGKWIAKGIGIAILVVGIGALLGYVVMYLWNWLMPDLFGLPEITFWKAVGLFVLAKILFGFGGDGHKGKKGSGRSGWKKRMKAKMEGMTPEERIAYKAKMRKCWGWDEEEMEKAATELAEGHDDTKNNA